MKERVISVTDAARNFADCINRVRYQGMTFILHKNGVAVARIVPEEQNTQAEMERAAVIRVASKGADIDEDEAVAVIHDIEGTSKPSTRLTESKRRNLHW